LQKLGLNTDSLFVRHGERTAAFTGVLDKNGDFFCGVADMAILEFIPKDHLDSYRFWESEILIIDSNIGEETLRYILSRSEKIKEVIYEPISIEKSEKILIDDFISRLTIFKPNLMQLQNLISKINGQSIELQGDFEQDKRMIKLMLC